jgi:2-polyprenyl-3-methyl-5-hydroxy-6-metoxy-1,4-benzoquinol methylase
MACCDVNGLNRIFSKLPARLAASLYAWRGPSQHTRSFAAELPDPRSKRVLDIGGGLGALSLALLERGAGHVQLVEVSRAFMETAERLAERAGKRERFDFVLGDAATLEALREADIVVLDRVVCCYPEPEALLRRAASLSRSVLAFTFPIETPLTRWTIRCNNNLMRLLRVPYRAFLHDPAVLRKAATSRGHRLADQRRLSDWQLWVFQK